MHIGNVAHIDDRSIDGFDRQIVEGCDHARRIVSNSRIFECAIFSVPTGVIRFWIDKR